LRVSLLRGVFCVCLIVKGYLGFGNLSVEVGGLDGCGALFLGE
jgi:hypothetical protein